MDERFLRAGALLGKPAMEKLWHSHVAVFGLGGVGSWCAEALARSGVGHLTLIDQDTVSLSNINRQCPALDTNIGLAKARVMAERIAQISPETRVNSIVGTYSADTREDFFGDYDFIADAIDLVSCKIDLIKTAAERNIPMISALGTGNKLDAGQLQICDISKTFGCPLARVVRRELRDIGINHHSVVFSPEQGPAPEQTEAPPPGRRSVPGSLIWVPATAGMLMAQHIVLELILLSN